VHIGGAAALVHRVLLKEEGEKAEEGKTRGGKQKLTNESNNKSKN
jgi:hypothetical protein